jgi:CRISPR system Cascade subunit CasC
VKIELHILQNFAPSNLNRDDTGAPKDCEFGGYRRARISSQSQKRAVRQAFELDGLVDKDHRGARTKRLVKHIADILKNEFDHQEDEALALSAGAIDGLGFGRDKNGSSEDDIYKTEYLLFVSRANAKQIAEVLNRNRDALVQPATADVPVAKDDKKRTKKDAKKAAEGAYPKEIKKELEALFETAGGAVDVALFGRMIADRPEWNVDAACQVAQALSTNRVQMDFDFFTAVDDLKPKDTAGSDMMGTVQFNSSCFYRYAVLDIDSLKQNLDNTDEELLQQAVRAFVQAFVSAIPTGKQNSMAAHNFPSYVLAVVRPSGQPLSLANAFLKPAHPRGEDVDLVDDSINKLEEYALRLKDVFGTTTWVSWADRDLSKADDRPTRADTIVALYTAVSSQVSGAVS